jgi:DNA-binding NtrC family response regulator
MVNPILIIDDERPILNSLMVTLAQHEIDDVDTLQDSRQAFQRIADGKYKLLLLDMDMPEVTGLDILRHVREHHPDIECIILTGVGDVQMAVDAMKLGAFDYLTKPASQDRLVFTIRRALEKVQMKEELTALRSGLTRQSLKSQSAFEEILTRSAAMISVLVRVEQMAPTRAPVLIWGESGTGKELVAQAIHNLSRRANRKFVAVNAGVFAAELFASEFFGYAKGAFTGAHKNHPGFLEDAHGGTLFLDEIGELPLEVQVKLLRVLQEGEFFRVGSTEKRKADVRIVAATNKDLHQEIRKGTFRKDLFYRLNINTVQLPPLWQREGDVAYLAHHFLRQAAAENERDVVAIADPALDVMLRYDYPGNVRELKNIIEGAVIVEQTEVLTLESLPPYLLDAARSMKPAKSPVSSGASVPETAGATLAQVEEAHIMRVLEKTGGNKTHAARVLGLSRAGLHLKLKKFHIT